MNPRRRQLVSRRYSGRGRTATAVWIILAIALLLRVGVVVATWHTPLNLDPADFNRTAASIAQRGTYPASNRAPGGGPSAFRPPAYPFFLAAIYAIAGHAVPRIGRLAGALLGAVSVALIGLIALRLWGKRVAMLALGIAAVAPPLVIFSTALVSEALFVPLVLAAVLCALEARGSPRPLWWAVATGVLVGLAALTRTNGVILLLPCALAFLTGRWLQTRRRWIAAALVVVSAVVVLVPWTVRNWSVFHTFVPVSDETGYTLAGTYNQVSRADRKLPAVWIEAEHGASPEYARILRRARAEHWNEVTYGDHLTSAALAEAEHHPFYVLKVGYWNAIRMFHLGEVRFAVANLRDTGIPLWLALFDVNTVPALLVLALGGLLTRRARAAPKWLWLVPVGLATSVFVTGFIRFRAPIDPFIVMLVALFAGDMVEQVTRLRQSLAKLRSQRDREALDQALLSRAGGGQTRCVS